MAQQKISEMTELASTPSSGDLIEIVDVSDTSEAATGTNKKIQFTNLITAQAAASDTVAGIVELATTAETTTGTDATRAVTPDGLRAFITTLTRIPLYSPQGFLINGKIVVTDAAGITVAIKTLAGTDPSATDPVYVRIGDTVRTISAALSVAKADGTNWCNAGSAELATFGVDYFVYLGYNATDGVVIGFSRIVANSYGEFSTTSTNPKYCAISTITNAASTDYYEVIGRFQATLSGGAGYTWSVPTYTAINLIQRPIYETRALDWYPTYTGFSSNVTTGKYRVVGNRLIVMAFSPTGTSNAAGFTYTLPFTAQTQEFHACYVIDNGVAVSPPGRVYTTSGSATVQAGKVVNADAGFTTSGTKSLYQPTFNLTI